MGADNSFYVKSVATYAPTFFVYIILVLAMVWRERDFNAANFFKLEMTASWTESF